jgi:hypothetical protein
MWTASLKLAAACVFVAVALGAPVLLLVGGAGLYVAGQLLDDEEE